MMRALFTFIMVVCCNTLSAALPPLFQGIAEIKAILADENIQKSLPSGEMIQNILKTDNGYIIFTQNYELDVEVRYLPMKVPGPQKFELNFHSFKK